MATKKKAAPAPIPVDVPKLLLGGESNKSIARELSIAEGTVKTHVKSVLFKLGAASRTEAAAIAARRGLVQR